MTAAEILRELVAIASPSAVSNLPVLRWVQDFLEPLGWQVSLLPYVDEAGIEKANLLGWPGAGEMPQSVPLAFVCHTDTVPFAVNWAGALRLEERNGNLHGCGACDVKGPLACFLAAASAGYARNVLLMLTADEEIGCKGMERLLGNLLATTGLRIGSVIVSEPTSLRPGVAGKGYGLARITVEGREAHSAFPAQGVSAISVAARLIARIEDAFALGQVEDHLFDPPRTTVNIGVIEGGTAKNIVAGRCTFLVEWRAVPGEPAGLVLARLHELAEEAGTAEPRAIIRLEGLRDEAGFAPAAAGALRARLGSMLAREPVGISFGSEASRIARIADEVVVIGPGDMRTAHSDRECVPIAELDRWTEELRELLSGGL